MARLPKTTRLADLLYGHSGRFIQMLGKGCRYDPSLATKQAICLGEMDCGCWIVLDGNNRTGLLIKANPDATVADYPESALIIEPKGTWDKDLMDWSTPCPKTFTEAMQPQKRMPRPKFKHTYYGMVERTKPGHFCGIITSEFRDDMITAQASSPAAVESRIRQAVGRRVKKLGASTDFDIKLTGDTEPEHECRRA